MPPGEGDVRAEKYKHYKSPNPKSKAREEREKSVLDTPAPRKKPPTPMSFDGSGRRDRSPAHSPSRGSPSRAARPRSGSPHRERRQAKERPRRKDVIGCCTTKKKIKKNDAIE